MNNKEALEKLTTLDKDKIVVLCDPDGIGWTNIGKIIEDDGEIKIIASKSNSPFSDDN